MDEQQQKKQQKREESSVHQQAEELARTLYRDDRLTGETRRQERAGELFSPVWRFESPAVEAMRRYAGRVAVTGSAPVSAPPVETLSPDDTRKQQRELAMTRQTPQAP